MAILLRYLPILALIIGLVIGYKVRDISADRKHAALEAEYAEYRLEATENAARAAKEILDRQNAQIKRNQEIENAKHAKDQQIAGLQRDLTARLRDVRLCHAKTRTAHRVPEADRGGTGRDPDASASEELPPETSGHLVELAADADRIVSQLESCQDFVKSLQGE